MANKKVNKKKVSKMTSKKAVQKPVKQIVEFYYMTPQEVTVKDMAAVLTCVSQEQIEIWTELNLMEIVLEHDSFIFQDARECFIDPLDLEFLQEQSVASMYEISYDVADEAKVTELVKELLTKTGGFICSDTEDFEPIFRLTGE